MCFWLLFVQLSGLVQLTVWKDRLRNDQLRVGWGVKLTYLLVCSLLAAAAKLNESHISKGKVRVEPNTSKRNKRQQ